MAKSLEQKRISTNSFKKIQAEIYKQNSKFNTKKITTYMGPNKHVLFICKTNNIEIKLETSIKILDMAIKMLDFGLEGS
jgi:hypothetical protein